MEQSELLRYVIAALDRLGIPYMVVGSFASSAYGEPRMTRDIDIVITLQREQVSQLCSAFPHETFYVSIEAATDALDHRTQFSVIHGESGNKIDFMISHDDAWGREQLARRQKMGLLPGCHGYVASPEDVIIGKLIYYQDGKSDKHLRDIASIIGVGTEQLDTDYVKKWAKELGLSELWNAVVARMEE